MTRSARPSNGSAAAPWRMPAIIAGVVALAVVAGLLLALVLSRDPTTGAGDPSPSETPIPSAPASPSEAPSEEPSEEPSEDPAPSDAPSPSAPAEPSDEGPWADYRDPVVQNPDGVLPPGGVVRVLVDGLRVREQAMVDSNAKMTLQAGDLLVVGPTFGYRAFGPSTEDGYTWYPVGVLGTQDLPAPGGDPMEFVEVGAVAVGEGDIAWVELLDPRCTDDEPTLQHLSSLTEWERLACYGNEQITFEGVLGCGGCGGFVGGEFTPEWLAHPNNYDLISVEPQDFIGPMALHWSPDGPERLAEEPGVAPILRVTGHFDDAASAECSHTWVTNTFGVQAETTTDPAISELFCRTNFVVDSYEVIGEDEDFPFG